MVVISNSSCCGEERILGYVLTLEVSLIADEIVLCHIWGMNDV